MSCRAHVRIRGGLRTYVALRIVAMLIGEHAVQYEELFGRTRACDWENGHRAQVPHDRGWRSPSLVSAHARACDAPRPAVATESGQRLAIGRAQAGGDRHGSRRTSEPVSPCGRRSISCVHVLACCGRSCRNVEATCRGSRQLSPASRNAQRTASRAVRLERDAHNVNTVWLVFARQRLRKPAATRTSMRQMHSNRAVSRIDAVAPTKISAPLRRRVIVGSAARAAATAVPTPTRQLVSNSWSGSSSNEAPPRGVPRCRRRHPRDCISRPLHGSPAR